MNRSIITNKTPAARFLGGLGVALFWVALWAIAAWLMGKELILPSPQSVVSELFRLGATKEFWKSVAASFGRIVAGFAIGVAAGIILAVLGSSVSLLGRVLSPAINILKASPVASFTILAMMWFKSDILPLVLSAVMVLPMLYSATLHAIEGIDPKSVEMARVFGLSKKQIFLSVKIRSLLPHIFAAAAAALGFAWKAGIAAEIICHPDLALGSELYDARQYLEMPTVFAVTAVTVVLSIALEALLKKVTAITDPKKGGEANADKH